MNQGGLLKDAGTSGGKPGDHPGASVRQWLVEAKLPDEVWRNVERLAGAEDVREVVLLPDIHLGRMVNNGCVAATIELVYPEAVGGDIGCGFSAIAFDGDAKIFSESSSAASVLSRLAGEVPALKLRRASGELPASLRRQELSDANLQRESQRDGVYQLGTLGCGNHFVEFQRDDAGRLWVMVHSGSRAMGQAIAGFHLARAASASTGLRYLDRRTDAGRAYLNDMEWAVRYATVSRLSILARCSEIMQDLFCVAADENSYLDCPHNFARLESHHGQTMMVHRKSANSARAGEPGLIAGSCGTSSYRVRGLGSEASLHSSSHGAGRLWSRTEASRRIQAADLRRQLHGVHYDERLVNELRDEAPAAYRDLREVLKAQRDLVRQEGRLTPVLNFKHPDRRERS